jgi:hypothetical protein
MSAIGQITGLVEAKVREVLGDLLGHNKKQDARLDAVEKRLDALEAKPAPATAAKAAPAKTTATAHRTTK